MLWRETALGCASALNDDTRFARDRKINFRSERCATL